jgi:hypothetical protein
MNWKTRKRLESILEDKRSLAASKALEGTDPDGLGAAIAEAKSYACILEMTQSRWGSDSVIAVILAVVVTIVAGILWSQKVSTTNVTLSVQTDNLSSHLSKSWELATPMHAQVVHLDHVSVLHDPALGLTLDNADSDLWCRFEGGQIVVQSLDIEKGALLNAAATNESLALIIGEQPFHGTIQILGKGKLTAGSSAATDLTKSYDLHVPETIEFVASGSKGIDSEIDIHLGGDWSLGVVPAAEISFDYELRPLADRQVLSGIRSGTLHFNDTSWSPIKLSASEHLSIGDTNRARIQIGYSRPVMLASLSGAVSHITMGDQQDERELAPSLLEYLYNNRSGSLFWAATTAGWALLWAIRKTIFR